MLGIAGRRGLKTPSKDKNGIYMYTVAVEFLLKIAFLSGLSHPIATNIQGRHDIQYNSIISQGSVMSHVPVTSHPRAIKKARELTHSKNRSHPRALTTVASLRRDRVAVEEACRRLSTSPRVACFAYSISPAEFFALVGVHLPQLLNLSGPDTDDVSFVDRCMYVRVCM